MDRIFTACHGTQLLVIHHLRRHLRLPRAREYLLWNPLENVPAIDDFMRSVIAAAGFADVLDMRDFEQLAPRRQGAATWWFESARRLRSDAKALRAWLEKNQIDERNVELWTDDPIHFNVIFPKGYLRRARHVKFPHAFNLEDSAAPEYRLRLVAARNGEPWLKRRLFQPWLRAISGCDVTAARSLRYDVGYTFDRPSPWCEQSVDVGRLISARSFRESLEALPVDVRDRVNAELAPIRETRRPLLLLLLFGLSQSLRECYQSALTRIFADRSQALGGSALAIKVHPSAKGVDEEKLFGWARANLPVPTFAIRSAVNLEFMLPELAPDFVLAGPCGALPVVRNLGIGQPIVLPEVMNELCRAAPNHAANYRQLAEGMQVW